MKANEIPEKVYFDGESRACERPIFSSRNIEYTRTDAFIEMAVGWLKSQDEIVGVSFEEDFITRFKDYMKGE